MHTVTKIFGGLLVCYIICICKRNISLLLELFLSLKVKALVAQSRPPLWDPMDCSPPRSSVHGILQARILEWVAISFSRVSFQPGDQTQVPFIAGRFWATREAPSFLEIAPNTDPERWSPVCMNAQSLQLYLTLCDPLDCSLLGSSVHGILQARTVEWVAMPSSRNKIVTWQKWWGWGTAFDRWSGRPLWGCDF